MDVRNLTAKVEKLAIELQSLPVCDQNLPKAMQLIKQSDRYLKLMKQQEKQQNGKR